MIAALIRLNVVLCCCDSVFFTTVSDILSNLSNDNKVHLLFGNILFRIGYNSGTSAPSPQPNIYVIFWFRQIFYLTFYDSWYYIFYPGKRGFPYHHWGRQGEGCSCECVWWYCQLCHHCQWNCQCLQEHRLEGKPWNKKVSGFFPFCRAQNWTPSPYVEVKQK